MKYLRLTKILFLLQSLSCKNNLLRIELLLPQFILNAMKPLICQCCGLPFSEKLRGTNRDHSKNSDYCLGCFKNGEFTNHQLTLIGMQKKLLVMARRRDAMSHEEAHQIISTLPYLKRWRRTHIL